MAILWALSHSLSLSWRLDLSLRMFDYKRESALRLPGFVPRVWMSNSAFVCVDWGGKQRDKIPERSSRFPWLCGIRLGSGWGTGAWRFTGPLQTHCARGEPVTVSTEKHRVRALFSWGISMTTICGGKESDTGLSSSLWGDCGLWLAQSSDTPSL